MEPVYMTKGELRSRLLKRLGYGGLGASAGNMVPYADDLLDEAQEQMYEALPNRLRVRDFDFTLSAGQLRKDVPHNCDVDRIQHVRVKYAGYWVPVDEGITYAHDSVVDTTSYPKRYEINYNPENGVGKHQIEFWPEPDADYPIRVVSEIKLGPFVEDGHFCSIDYRLLLLYAVAHGKAHLGRRDASQAMDALTYRLFKLRGNQHQGKRYIRSRGKAREVLTKPRVVE